MEFLNENNSIGNINIDSKNKVIKGDFFHLPFYKKDFFDVTDYVKFIKSVERLVRSSNEYRHYISYLKEEVGLNHCMLQPNITDELADIEMHHGPILTLFDYCEIVCNYFLNKKEGINTFKIAHIILQEHFENNVQVVMLTETNHQALHAGKVFIHPSQAWGNLNNFINKYREGLTDEQIETFNQYITLSKSSRTTDGDFLKVAKKLKSYSSNNSYSLSDFVNYIDDVTPKLS